MLYKPEKMSVFFKRVSQEMYKIGIGSLPIIAITSSFIGAVTTVQTAYQLVSGLISKTVIGTIVSDSTMLELGPTISCLVLSGKVGAHIASEIGNMRISEQIDALEIMGINTKTYLVLPKILAALLVIPMLVIIAGVLGIWGGRLAGSMAGIVPPATFDQGLLEAFEPFKVIFALYKAYTFAFIISSISAFYGYYVKGGALEIGRASTKAVVISCILILAADYILAALLL